MALGLIVALWLCPIHVLACSEEAVPGLTDYNRAITQRIAVLSITLLIATVILYFKRRKKGLPIIVFSVVLLVFQPAWSYGGGGGDCGRSMVENAQWIAGFLAVGVAYQLTLWLVKRRGIT